jgi:quinoprotein glucose dehydrogenase
VVLVLVSPVAIASMTDGEEKYQVIPAADPARLTPANGWPARESLREWTRSNGGPTSNRFSVLDQINRQNVTHLEVAWTYRSGDGARNIQCNPIVVNGTLFAPTAGNRLVALDAASGRERWSFKPDQPGQPALRGLLFWPGEVDEPARIIFTVDGWIYALDPATGRPISSFGQGGRVKVPTGTRANGAIWKRVLVIPGYLSDVFGYDITDGQLLWRFHIRPRSGEFGADTWQGQREGANCWGGLSLDESRGIVYVATGSPKPNYVGVGHLGDNLFSNCVLALEAVSGRRLWHFQEIRHDIWDMDIPAPPNLVSVMREGRRVDAVAQVTKLGHTLLLDRLTGEPLFPFRLRRAPASTLPGEKTAHYQPDPELPEPFMEHVFEFKLEHVTRRSPEARAAVEVQLKNVNMGWFAPFEPDKPTVYYGQHGGANWPGASFDPDNRRLYVSASVLPYLVTITRDDDPLPLTPSTPGEQVYQLACASCHGPALGGMGMIPPLRGLRQRMAEREILSIIEQGRAAMPPVPMLSGEQKRDLLDFLLVRDRPHRPAAPDEPPRYAFGNYRQLRDHEGYPGINPPWGTLSCLDLDTGRLVWRVPLGEHDELSTAGMPVTGTHNFGGPMATAGGLVFCSGTRDRRIRAFDAGDGRELWSALLPWDGSGPPATYEIDGRQFIVVAAAGGGKLAGPAGDAWVAFALGAGAAAP